MKKSSLRDQLVITSKETLAVLPSLMKELPNVRVTESELVSLDGLVPLTASACPNHPKKAIIRVINEDSYNAAQHLMAMSGSASSSTAAMATSTTAAPTSAPKARSSKVLVLNLASEKSPGGGFVVGAMAQEEALCYRSSLYLSLHKRYYPLRPTEGVYTPDVLIVRSDLPSGHSLLAPSVAPPDLPVVSVASVAALRRPDLAKRTDTATGEQRALFASAADRDLTKRKMRLVLRMAAWQGHDRLVLGAMGCGAFRNPPHEVAVCWREVLLEPEFAGGWWKAVWFAVYDRKDEGNFEVFRDVLAGLQV